MKYEHHLLTDRFFLGREMPELHREIDGVSGPPADFSRFGEHIQHHTPAYAVNEVLPKYGTEGVKSHLLHVLGDLSPLQVLDFIQWARRSE